MKKLIPILLVPALAFAAVETTYSNFSYDTINFAFTPGSEPIYRVSAGYAWHENGFAHGTVKTDLSGATRTGAAVGFMAPFSDYGDLTGELGFEVNTEAKTDTGVKAKLGARYWVTPQFEVGSSFGVYDGRDSAQFIAEGQLRYHLSRSVSVGIGVESLSREGADFLMGANFKI